MTEFWKSNAMFWCDYCKVWMNDNPATKATHEGGMKHKDNVARKLRQMRQKQDQSKRDLVESQRSMSAIEAAAQRQYQADLKAADELQKQKLGEWAKTEGSEYHYNAVHQCYYDTASGMYYGGDPPTWTKVPGLPEEARYEIMHAPPTPQEPSCPSNTARPAAVQTPVAKKAGTIHHPMAELGGYKMPAVGNIGGAKGIGVADGGVKKRTRQPDKAVTSKAAKPASKEEADAIAAREAAKKRVQQRTLSTFGLG